MPSLTSQSSAYRALIIIAGLIVIVAGLKAAANLLIPIALAVFFAILCIPAMKRLEKIGIPTWIAICIIIVITSFLFILITTVLGNSIGQLNNNLPLYRTKILDAINQITGWLQDLDLPVNLVDLSNIINIDRVMTFASDAVSNILTVLSNLFLILLTMIFILFEASSFEKKLQHATEKTNLNLTAISEITVHIYDYMEIKAALSLATAIAVTILLQFVGVDFPLLWGLLAFFFNFIPNIGSFLAATPAILLTMLQLGTIPTIVVASGYALINMVIGNAIEPRLIGNKLGLSTLVVFLSLLFWGWVWGSVGMILSVPLTIIVKIMLEHNKNFSWVAIFLGSANELKDSNRLKKNNQAESEDCL